MTRPPDPPEHAPTTPRTRTKTATSTTASTTSTPRSDRWTCARCGRDHSAYRSWPEGHLCRTCVLAALDIHGTCPNCDDRVLPGRSPDGASICPACAGIVHSVFRCRRCQHEGRLYHRKLCIRCTVADRVAALLDNGTGHIDPALAPLAATLSTGPTPTPAGRLVWLGKPHARDLLRALATRTLPLTHDGLTGYPDQAGIPYLRALLMHCGALPEVDRQLLDFEAWLTRRLDHRDARTSCPGCGPAGRSTPTGTVGCPAGVTASIRPSADGGGAASFGPACANCPLRDQCTTAAGGRTVTVGPHEATLAAARARQRDPDWITDYRATRPKVERKIGHLMRRQHGGRRARVRGTIKLDADFRLLAGAVNLARLAVRGLRSTPTRWAVPA